jgi:hypothetical protein
MNPRLAARLRCWAAQPTARLITSGADTDRYRIGWTDRVKAHTKAAVQRVLQPSETSEDADVANVVGNWSKTAPTSTSRSASHHREEQSNA